MPLGRIVSLIFKHKLEPINSSQQTIRWRILEDISISHGERSSLSHLLSSAFFVWTLPLALVTPYKLHLRGIFLSLFVSLPMHNFILLPCLICRALALVSQILTMIQFGWQDQAGETALACSITVITWDLHNITVSFTRRLKVYCRWR